MKLTHLASLLALAFVTSPAVAVLSLEIQEAAAPATEAQAAPVTMPKSVTGTPIAPATADAVSSRPSSTALAAIPAAAAAPAETPPPARAPVSLASPAGAKAATSVSPAPAPSTAQSAPPPTIMPMFPISPASKGGASATAVGQTWDVKLTDINLLTTFQRWAAAADYRIKWDAARHILIDAPHSYQGSFEEAMEEVLRSPGVATSDYPLEVCFYPNQPPLARITRRGEQAETCK